MKKKILLVALLMNLLAAEVHAAAFVVKNIEVDGLQRISSETVTNYLPIKRGQTLRPDKTAAIIKLLYQTGFFEHINLYRRGDTLVVDVVERPTIGQLKITGNSVVPTDKLTSVMKSVDIAEGRVYNRAMLDKIKQGLLNQYYELGRYNARVEVTVTPASRNRVMVKIDISEGLVARVDKINIIGNHAFKQKVLEKQLDLTTPGLLTFFTQTDRYAQEKLESSLEKLRNYYLDHGYVRFAIQSAQVGITPDRKSVYLTIVVDEGAAYHVKGFSVSGTTIVPREKLEKLVTFKAGDVFSRQKILDCEKSMNDVLGQVGYLYAEVNLNPNINDVDKTVFLDFNMRPGKRTYVRHIYFTENSKTNDEVLRREIEQMENAVVSTKRLDDSKHKLKLKPFIKEVDMGIVPVPNHDDMVDVNYKITEQSSAEASFSVGYSQLDRVILGAGFNQKNFLGTGKTLGINASRSRFQTTYGINFTDPYYTQDGISRTISLAASKFNPGAANITNGYTSDEYDGSVTYGIPLGQEAGVLNEIDLGYGYQSTLVNLNGSNISNQVTSFVNDHGRHFQQLDLIAGYSRDGRDKAIFPTRGYIQSLGLNFYLPLATRSLTYYNVAYDSKWYQPLFGNFIATAKGDIAYGSSLNGGAQNYPFFKNYYAGGFNSVQGFLGNSLGPQDSTGLPSGGNFLADASLGIIFPNPIQDTLRTTAFVDIGNVYNTYDNRQFGGTASGPLRSSYGVEADWLTPLGVMIDVSLAAPIRAQTGDKREPFQFSLGANFG